MDEDVTAIRQTLEDHSKQIAWLHLAVAGDDPAQIRGLLKRTADLETIAAELVAWRQQVQTYWVTAKLWGRIVVLLLSAIGAGAWYPQLRELLNLLP